MTADKPLDIRTLPLFPLHSVLFPHFTLQLHIFEERYKAMINGCIERGDPFGVVLIREGEEVGAPAVPHEIGCTARILAVKKLEDGRMFLLAAGEERFRLLDYVEAELPYLLGRVEPLAESLPAEETQPALAEEVGDLFLRYLLLLAEQAGLPPPKIEMPDDPALLSFCVASVMQASLPEKQRLLEIVETGARLQAESLLLRALIEELEAQRVRNQSLPADPEAESGVLILEPVGDESRQRFREENKN